MTEEQIETFIAEEKESQINKEAENYIIEYGENSPIVKYMEDKSAKDKLWKIEFTVPLAQEQSLDNITWISHSKIKIDEK